VLQFLVTSFYVGEQTRNLQIFFMETVLMGWFRIPCPGHEPGDNEGGDEGKCPMTFVYCLVEVAFFMCICGVLFRKGIFWKL